MPPTPVNNTDIESWIPTRSGWSRWLERLALAVERPVNRLIGNTQLNPFYHTGKIAVLLLGIVAITGFYLFLFFQYGFDASYSAIVRMEESQPIARLMRAVHRYSSGALVITTLLHGYRILFMERFRGPRWLAWLTGIFMTFILWLAGVTGYWLLWDARAQVITDQFIGFVDRFTPWGAALAAWLISAETGDASWPILFLIVAIHIALFLLTVYLFWLHIRHLSRPKWFPDFHWIVGATVVLLLISALFPARLLPPFDTSTLPATVNIDPIFLFYLPINQTAVGPLLWLFLWAATIGAAVLPWFPRRPQPPTIRVIDEKCTGCTKCAQDCPYNAIEMVPRQDDSKFQLLAVADPAKCVSCGICIGSCDDFFAITLGDVAPESVWLQVESRLQHAQAVAPDKAVKLIFTCARHAAQGAAPYLDGFSTDEAMVEVITLPCSGAIAPTFLPRAIAAGAAEVAVVGCPPDDCANRLGNEWEEARVTNERVPRLRKRHDHDPVTAAWLPPDDFAQTLALTEIAVTESDSEPDYLSTRIFKWLNWRNFVIGFALLAVVLVVQVWLTGLSFELYPQRPVLVQVVVPDATQPVTLTVDGETVWQAAPDSAESLYQQIEIAPGMRRVRLTTRDASGRLTLVTYDETLTLTPGNIVRPFYQPAPRPACPPMACPP